MNTKRNTMLSRWGAKVRSLFSSPASPAFHPVGMADFGVAVSNDSAMKLTAFSAGIRYFADNISSLPKVVTEELPNGSRRQVGDHYLSALLNQPNGYTNKMVFWAVMTTWLKGWGNAYAIIERNPSGYPIALHQVHPASVQVTTVEGRKWFKVRCADSKLSFLNGTYPDEDMIHIMEMTLDGIHGLDVVRYNAMALGKSLAMEQFAADYYRKKGHIKGVLETDSSLGDDTYEKFMKHYQDSATNFSTPLLEYGIKYKQLSVNPVTAQLVQSETMSIQDIARMLNIPPHMLYELSHATFSNIEHQTMQFVQYCLRPVVKKIEVELESKLLFPADQGRYNIKISLEGLLRGDTAARATFYHNAILDGYMSRNEVRYLEGLEAKEGLDDFLYPLNTGVVGKEPDKDNNK